MICCIQLPDVVFMDCEEEDFKIHPDTHEQLSYDVVEINDLLEAGSSTVQKPTPNPIGNASPIKRIRASRKAKRKNKPGTAPKTKWMPRQKKQKQPITVTVEEPAVRKSSRMVSVTFCICIFRSAPSKALVTTRERFVSAL
jgi:type VI protein secretion system component VasA